MHFLSQHVTRPSLQLYLVSFGASSTVVGAVMAVFTITATMMRIPVGMLIDRIGRKPFLLAGVVLFIAANFGYLWAPSILLMLPFRVLHGVGWSGCTTAVATLSADVAFQKRRGELMGAWQAAWRVRSDRSSDLPCFSVSTTRACSSAPAPSLG